MDFHRIGVAAGGDNGSVLASGWLSASSQFMFRTLLVLSILVPGLVAAFGSGYWALMVYLWLALFRPQEWLWFDITSLRLSLLVGLLMLGRSAASGIFPNVTNPLTLGMFLLVLSSVVTQTTAIQPDIGWIWIDFLFRLVLCCAMLVGLSTTAKRLFGLLAVIATSIGFHAAKAGLAFVLTGGTTRFNEGLSGAFFDNNGYALGTVMTLPLLLATAQNVEMVYSGRWLRWIRYGLYAATALCGFTAIGTYSRGGFLALAAAILTLVLLQRRRFTALAGLVALVGFVLLAVPIPQRYFERLDTIRTYEQASTEDIDGARESAQSRPHFWRVGLLMVSNYPLGIGVKQYEAAYDKFDFSFGLYGHHRAVHNSHIQVLAELGYIGAFIWVGLFVYAYFACMRVRVRSRNEGLSPVTRRFLMTMANGLLASMTGFVIGGSFLSSAYNDLTWLTFALVAALDRISLAESTAPAAAVAARDADVPVPFRAVPSFATASKAWQK
jgi:probable O-glycosylation ligase (exosortase A-associated)